MTKFFENLRGVLKQDERFTDRDGKLLRNKISEAATLLDENLLTLLLNDDTTRQTFFKDAAGVKVFKQREFVQLVNGHEFLPDSYTRYAQNIGLVDANDNLISKSAAVALVFPYKDCLLEGGQTKDDQKRTEIFYNTTLAKDDCDRLLAPKVFANATRYDAHGYQPAETPSAKPTILSSRATTCSRSPRSPKVSTAKSNASTSTRHTTSSNRLPRMLLNIIQTFRFQRGLSS